MRGRRRLPFGSVRVLLIRLVTADDASSDSADFAVPRQMARDAANDGAFDASLCLGGGASKGEAQDSGTDDERLHRDSSRERGVAIIGMAAIRSARGNTAAGQIRSSAAARPPAPRRDDRWDAAAWGEILRWRGGLDASGKSPASVIWRKHFGTMALFPLKVVFAPV